MSDQRLYGATAIASAAGISERTLWRWIGRADNDFLKVASISNVGGGLGRAVMTFNSSIQAFKEKIDSETSEARRIAALTRWHPTGVSSCAAW